MSVPNSLEPTVNSKPDLVSSDIMISSPGDCVCPKCNQEPYFVKLADGSFKKVDVLEGPFFRYERRVSELYFDLREKFFHCSNCGKKLIVLDYQVMVESLCSMLPPEYARKFSMKNMSLYGMYPRRMKKIMQILVDDFEPGNEMLLPKESGK